MFVTNWISTTKIQKISEITNFFRHYFLSRTEVILKSLLFKVGLFLRTNFSKSSKSIGKSAQYLYFNVQTNLPLSITSKTNVFIVHLLPALAVYQINKPI